MKIFDNYYAAQASQKIYGQASQCFPLFWVVA